MGLGTGQHLEDWIGGTPKSGRVLTVTGTTGARSDELTPGLYRIATNTACWFRVGGSTVTASKTASTTADNPSAFLPAGSAEWFVIDDANLYVHVLKDASTDDDGVCGVSRYDK